MKCKTTLTSLVAAACLFVSSCAMPQRMDEYRTHPEKYDPNYAAAILVAEPTVFYDYLRAPFMWIYELRVANALKNKLGVDSYYLVKNASKEDLESALINNNIKVVVVAGHGDDQGCSMGVTENDLRELLISNPEINKDWFIRHTCGSKPKEVEYIPRAAFLKALKEVREAGGALDNVFGFFIVSARPLLEEYNAIRDQRNLSEEEWNYFIEKEHYINAVLHPKINEELTASAIKAKNTFGYTVVEDPNHVLGWNRITTPLDFLLNPLPGLDKAKRNR